MEQISLQLRPWHPTEISGSLQTNSRKRSFLSGHQIIAIFLLSAEMPLEDVYKRFLIQPLSVHFNSTAIVPPHI